MVVETVMGNQSRLRNVIVIPAHVSPKKIGLLLLRFLLDNFTNAYVTIVLVDCQWSSWSRWSACSRTCGTGTREKSRQVLTSAKNGGDSCQGPSRQTERCNLGSCVSG